MLQYVCLKCDFHWKDPESREPRERCPSCHSKFWDTPTSQTRGKAR